MDSATLPAMPPLSLTPEDGRKRPVLPGHLSALVATHGSVELRWYAPKLPGDQVPHDRDEIYFIVAGTAVFLRGEFRTPFSDDQSLSLAGEDRVAVKPGDAVFVPAGTVHQFEAMSPDFGSWMIFYGPEGGEVQ